MYAPKKYTYLTKHLQVLLRLKFFIIAIGICIVPIMLLLSPVQGNKNVTFDRKFINRCNVNVITANLNDPKIKVNIGLAKNGISHNESFMSMVKRRLPIAAVTGTYFDLKSLLPVGSIVTEGKTAYRGYVGTSVCFIKDGKIQCSPYSVKFTNKKTAVCSGIECALSTGPRLLTNGNYALNPRVEGFKDKGIFGRRTRMVMGITIYNKMLLVNIKTPVSLNKTASIMKKLGAFDAVCLDGGTSSAMYFRGRLIQSPGRKLTNIVEIYETRLYAGNVETKYPKQINIFTALARMNKIAIIDAALPTAAIRACPCHRQLRETNEFWEPERFNAVLNNTEMLTGSKRFHTFVPVYRTKLSGLKGFYHPENFVNIAANIKVMHHLIS